MVRTAASAININFFIINLPGLPSTADPPIIGRRVFPGSPMLFITIHNGVAQISTQFWRFRESRYVTIWLRNQNEDCTISLCRRKLMRRVYTGRRRWPSPSPEWRKTNLKTIPWTSRVRTTPGARQRSRGSGVRISGARSHKGNPWQGRIIPWDGTSYGPLSGCGWPCAYRSEWWRYPDDPEAPERCEDLHCFR